MNYIEKVLALLDLQVNEPFYIKKCRSNNGDYTEYCIDAQGHVLYRNLNKDSKIIWLSSKVFNLQKILNGTCTILKKENKDA